MEIASGLLQAGEGDDSEDYLIPIANIEKTNKVFYRDYPDS